MSFYTRHVYARLASTLGNPPPIHKLRRQLISLARSLAQRSVKVTEWRL